MTELQSTGSYEILDETFSISFSPNNRNLITFEGLSVEDMRNIKSLVDILLEYHDETIDKDVPN
jgi:hypothetical protein